MSYLKSSRPQLFLDGTWQFHIEGETDVQTIPVPLPWEAAFPHLRDKPTTATYMKTVRVPRSWQKNIVRLHVGAADYYSEVSVNGYFVGVNEGGYLPFDLEISDFLRWGDTNEIVIKVSDGAPARMVTGEGDLTPERTTLDAMRPFPFTEIPHGKQSWYGTVGGIWQSVWLEACGETFVDNVFVRPVFGKTDGEHGASVRVLLAHPPLDPDGWSVRVSVAAPNGAAPVEAVETPLTRARGEVINLSVAIPNPALWDMDNPHLYGAAITLLYKNKAVDEFQTRFGMRHIEAREGRIYLNDVPVFLAGVLDQDFYPTTIYTPPSTEFLRDQFVKAKALGLNTMRCHIKTPDPRYLDLCDELGLLVWYEIPNWAVLTKKSAKRGREHLEKMLARDYNHASLLIVTIMNESWGINLREKWQRQWLVEMFDYAKSLDSTRLMVDNSACEGNFHVKSDIDDFHVYFSIPDHAEKWADWCGDFAGRAPFTYSRYGDAQRTKKEPLLLSEFGNWGLPKLSLLRKGYGGEDPWWFQTGAGAARPEGLEARFYQFNLDRVYQNYDALADVSQEAQWQSLKYEIEAMRKHSGIVGYVITEFTDLHWEANGLLDICRNPKVFHDRMATVQGQDLVVPDHQKTAYWSNSAFRLPLLLSHFGTRDLRGATVSWHVDGYPELTGQFTLADTPVEIGTSDVGEITFQIPEVAAPVQTTLHLRLHKNNETINENTDMVAFFPASLRQMQADVPVFLHDPLQLFPAAKAILQSGGVVLAEQLNAGVLCLTSQMDEKVTHFAQNGGTVLLLALDRESLPRIKSGLASVTRDKNGWWGDWCSGLIFFRPDEANAGGPWANLPQTAHWNWLFRTVVPRRVLVGWSMETEFNDIWAGLVLGWLRLPASLAAGFRVGNGKVFATTLDLFTHAKGDPVSVVLLANLVRFAASDAFAPRKTVEMARLELPLTLLATAESKTGTDWKYTTTAPPPNWAQSDFDDGAWKTGKSGFGRGVGQVNSRTRWRETDIYLRTIITVPQGGVSEAQLRLFHDDDCEIYLNGQQILTRAAYNTDYEDIALLPEQIALFVPGENVIAAHCRNETGPQYFDLGITVQAKNAPPNAASSAADDAGVTPENAPDTPTSSQEMAKEKEPLLEGSEPIK